MSSPQIGDNTSPTSFVNPEPLPDRFSAVQGLFRQTVSSFQRQTLSQCLVDAEGDLKTYQAEINRLKARMIALEMRRDRLDETITNYRSLLSPICRMPIEILGHIFSFCCETNHISDLDSVIVIVLSAVCGHWRGIVLATPRLWSSMTLNLQEAECIEDEDYTCRLMNLFMARSRKELLDLEFYGVEAEAFEHFEAGFHCLLEHSNRWRSVAFPGDDPCWLNQPTSPFRHLEGRCLPNLEHLFLNFCTDSDVSDDDGDRMASDLALFSKSPKLNSIHIRGGTLPSGCRFPWAQIQSLRLSDYKDSNLGHMMTLCRNVRRLELERVDTDPDDLESPTDLNTTLEKLQSVSVRDSEGDGSLLFWYFTFPSLSSLDLCGYHVWFWSPWNSGPLVDFLRRSSCPLTSITIKHLPLSDTETLNLLVVMPTLTHLSIDDNWHALRPGAKPPPPHNPIVTTTFLEHFIVNPGDKRSRDFLPRLTDLTLTIFPLEPSDQRALERTLASRVTTLRALVLTVLVSNDVECKSDYDSITCFRAAGMRVHCSFQVTSI